MPTGHTSPVSVTLHTNPILHNPSDSRTKIMTNLNHALGPRYSIRPLQMDDLRNTKALLGYSMVFLNKMYRPIYTHDLTLRLYKYFEACELFVKHQILSGYSLGVFDNEFDSESREQDGQLLWDFGDVSATEEQLLKQMNFPLVAIALASDSFYPIDMSQLGEFMALRPGASALYRQFQAQDKRDPKSWKATGPGQVLQRYGTATRKDHEGRGVAKAAAHAMMHKCAEDGFRAIQLESVADAVTRIWMNPPAPFRTDLVCEFELYDQTEVDEQGNVTYPFRPARQKAWRGYCHLK